MADEKFDSEAANVRLVKRMKEAIWRACPGYLFGYNAGTQITWSVGADNVPASFREKCKDDGLIANEALAFPGDVSWDEYAKLIRREAEIVRYYGGHHSTYPFDRGGNRPYNFIVNLALRSHMMGWYQGPVFEAADFNRFGARFASLAVGPRPADLGRGGPERLGEIRAAGVVAAVRRGSAGGRRRDAVHHASD